jgi:ribosomal protein S18 acetylase RimI-like enzyme
MQLYIDTYFNPKRVLEEINSNTIQFYLAFASTELVGYIKARTEDNPPELAGVKHIEIERIYVHPGYKGLKIGKQLIDHAAIEAKQQGYEVLWLGVWEKNENAIAFYKKQGFTIFGEHDFVLGTDAQKDWLMKKEL